MMEAPSGPGRAAVSDLDRGAPARATALTPAQAEFFSTLLTS